MINIYIYILRLIDREGKGKDPRGKRKRDKQGIKREKQGRGERNREEETPIRELHLLIAYCRVGAQFVGHYQRIV